MPKKPYSTTDPQKLKEQDEEFKLKRERELKDLRTVLKTGEGRAVLRRILERCHPFLPSFIGKGSPNSETFLREGERNIGLFIMAEVEEADRRMLLQIMFKEGE